MENPHEERQLLLLERIIKNVHLVNDALVEMTRSVAEINEFNKNVTIVGELWEGVSVCYKRSQWICTNSISLLILFSIDAMLHSISAVWKSMIEIQWPHKQQLSTGNRKGSH